MRVRDLRQLIRLQPLEHDAAARRLSHCHDVDDLRAAARRALPKSVFDYVDGGADEEVSLVANRDAFQRYRFVPRAMEDVASINLATRVLGSDLQAPIGLAPTGYTRMVDPAGELAVARAAASRGVPYVLSTVGTTTIEELAFESHRNLWFQLYVLRDRGLTWSLMERATAADISTLEISVDTAASGHRLRDVRNGFTIPPTLTLSTLADIGFNFGYWVKMVKSPALSFANIAPPSDDGLPTIADISSLFDPTLGWDDLADIRARWPGQLLVKGPLSGADAERAVAVGVDGVHLSNHGGRQLDRAIAPIELVRPVRERVGEECTIVMDSGIRHGADVLVALARGADLCMVGRPYLYGLAVAGERGVCRAIDLLLEQL
ncbi:MAG: alpha-hydroxy acid oxidase [Acidimicrobiales bacterium]